MPYRPYINKIVQTSRADDIRHYNIVLIYNKKELHKAHPDKKTSWGKRETV